MKTWVAPGIALVVLALGGQVGHAADACPAEVREAQDALANAKGERTVLAPGPSEASGLVREAEAACKQGNMIVASRKAQEALGLLGKAPSIGHPDLGAKTPPPEKAVPARPRESDYYQPSPNVTHDPTFIGPTGRTRTGEFGFSAWIAPTTPVGSEVAGGRGQGGAPAIGFTFSWGGGSRPSEPIQAP